MVRLGILALVAERQTALLKGDGQRRRRWDGGGNGGGNPSSHLGEEKTSIGNVGIGDNLLTSTGRPPLANPLIGRSGGRGGPKRSTPAVARAHRRIE